MTFFFLVYRSFTLSPLRSSTQGGNLIGSGVAKKERVGQHFGHVDKFTFPNYNGKHEKLIEFIHLFFIFWN
jgi:hypothetical protein